MKHYINIKVIKFEEQSQGLGYTLLVSLSF